MASPLRLRWEALVGLFLDLKKNGSELPPDILNSIRCCGSLINHYEVHYKNFDCDGEDCKKLYAQAVAELNALEDYLVRMAAIHLGKKDEEARMVWK